MRVMEAFTTPLLLRKLASARLSASAIVYDDVIELITTWLSIDFSQVQRIQRRQINSELELQMLSGKQLSGSKDQ